jgi:hypothetical protein
MAKRTKKQSGAAAEAPTMIAKMAPSVAISGFKAQAQLWHRQSLAVVASGAVCMIVGAHAPNGNRIEYDGTVAKLKVAVAETGIRQAQIYKYVGLSRAFVSHLFKSFQVTDGPVQGVLQAADHDEAMKVLLDYMAKEKLKSLDDLGVFVGKYRRTENGAPAEGAGDGDGEGQDGAPTPTRASPEAIAARVVSDPQVLNAVSAPDLVQSYLTAGHKPSELIEALIPHIDTVRECSKLITKLTNKLARLRNGLKVATRDGKRVAA